MSRTRFSGIEAFALSAGPLSVEFLVLTVWISRCCVSSGVGKETAKRSLLTWETASRMSVCVCV